MSFCFHACWRPLLALACSPLLSLLSFSCVLFSCFPVSRCPRLHICIVLGLLPKAALSQIAVKRNCDRNRGNARHRYRNAFKFQLLNMTSTFWGSESSPHQLTISPRRHSTGCSWRPVGRSMRRAGGVFESRLPHISTCFSCKISKATPLHEPVQTKCCFGQIP